jgi:hypothetical protein
MKDIWPRANRILCTVAGFGLLGLGVFDIQSGDPEKGTPIVGAAAPLIAYVVGTKSPNGKGKRDK